MEDLGAVSLIPTVVVFVLAILTHRPIESLISGSIVGLMIIHGAQFIGATLSASTFGSHACFYSDATVLTAQASGCTPMQHALTQIP